MSDEPAQAAPERIWLIPNSPDLPTVHSVEGAVMFAAWEIKTVDAVPYVQADCYEELQTEVDRLTKVEGRVRKLIEQNQILEHEKARARADLAAPRAEAMCEACCRPLGTEPFYAVHERCADEPRDAAAAGPPECEWKEDDNAYETGCGKAFVLPDTPHALGMEFCCLCGRALKEVK